MNWLKSYGTTEGPIGLPMSDAQAFALEEVLKGLPPDPERKPGRFVDYKATAEIFPGERADISIISAESIDRDRDIVLARGMNDSHFKLNPLVTLQHSYWMPPVGKSAWRQLMAEKDPTEEGTRVKGIRAKTTYPDRPELLPSSVEWMPDEIFALVQSGLMAGKSVGFIPMKYARPTEEEIVKRPELKEVRYIIKEWLLLEYAVCTIPAQQLAVCEQVSKSVKSSFRKALGVTEPEPFTPPPPVKTPEIIPFTPIDQVEKFFERELASLNPAGLVDHSIKTTIDRMKGRV